MTRGSGKLPLEERAGILKQRDPHLCNQYSSTSVTVA